VAFHCEGYLNDPEGLRCAVYRQQGFGHGDVTLFGAVACNCNTFFAHYVNAIHAQTLLQAAQQFGFGSPTGIELASEAGGSLPRLIAGEEGAPPKFRTGEAQLFVLGHGSFTATPLQLARAMAAVANGGRLVTPRIIASPLSNPDATCIDKAAVRQIHESLCQAVTDETGAAHESLLVDGVPVAGLSATGEASGHAPDHAWCAGYFPANSPRLAFAIALEHGGDGAKSAASIAKRLIRRSVQLGL
jgi:penicillin-binding protein 2